MRVVYFVTGMGASGTLWMAKLLNKDPDVTVHHEAINYDVGAYVRIRDGRQDMMEYLATRKEMMERRNIEAWAEVNSYLRYMTSGLRKIFGCPVAGLIRDGRYVVRHLVKRGAYSIPKYPKIRPPFDSPDTPAFNKCCWYWADAYRVLVDDEVPIFKLERISADFDYFATMCCYLNTTVSRSDWEQMIKKRAHVFVGSDEPPDWSAEQRCAFAELAGDIQEKFGYPYGA